MEEEDVAWAEGDLEGSGGADDSSLDVWTTEVAEYCAPLLVGNLGKAPTFLEGRGGRPGDAMAVEGVCV